MTAKNEGKVLRPLSYAIGARSAKKLVQVTLLLACTFAKSCFIATHTVTKSPLAA